MIMRNRIQRPAEAQQSQNSVFLTDTSGQVLTDIGLETSSEANMRFVRGQCWFFILFSLQLLLFFVLRKYLIKTGIRVSWYIEASNSY